MHNRFHEATALYSTESAFNADRDLVTGTLKVTQHTIAAIDRDQGGMWSDDVAHSEALAEVAFVRIFTSHTAAARALLEAIEVSTDTATSIAAGTKPVWPNSLLARGLSVQDLASLRKMIAHVKTLREQRIARRVHCFERAWLEKVICKMHDFVRPGKESGTYGVSGASQG